MKRGQMLRRIARAARETGVVWELEQQGANHEIWRCGSIRVPVPRHGEIDDRLASTIFEELEAELGKEWWRR